MSNGLFPFGKSRDRRPQMSMLHTGIHGLGFQLGFQSAARFVSGERRQWRPAARAGGPHERLGRGLASKDTRGGSTPVFNNGFLLLDFASGA